MEKASLKQIAYDTIKQKIINCEYEPGAFLNEELLCQKLKMSRTPVRDALGRLEQEHLVTIHPKKGFQIMPITTNEVINVYEGRLLLEPYIIRTYCTHMDKSVLEKMRTLLKEEMKVVTNSGFDIYQLDREFHMLLISQCRNEYLLNLYRDLSAQNERIRFLAGKLSEDRLHVTFDEHAKVFYELTMNHVEGAARAMEEHLKASKESSLEAFMKLISFL